MYREAKEIKDKTEAMRLKRRQRIINGIKKQIDKLNKIVESAETKDEDHIIHKTSQTTDALISFLSDIRRTK
jgi:hypothetical protein